MKNVFRNKNLFFAVSIWVMVLQNSWLEASSPSTSATKPLTEAEQEKLQEERTTNLVILNDFQEINDTNGSPAIRQELQQALRDKQVVLCTESVFLAAKEKYGEIVPDKYICKKVNDDYILFVPKAMQHNNERPEVRDALLGLSYVSLDDYDDNTHIFGTDEIEKKSKEYLKTMTAQPLLDALAKLQIKDISRDELPFMNIFLSGHGTSGTVAGMFALSKGAKEPSDFIKVMNVFDKSFRTKSVALMSCFIGGKQIKDVYKMYDAKGLPVWNKFENAFLQNLSYTIINEGSLFQETLAKPTMNFTQYFSWLNESVPNFQEILEHVRYDNVDNYISIKLPYTSWFTPVEFKEDTQTLSQVAMSTKKTDVAIKDDTKVIILQANYIPQTVKIDSSYPTSLPIFMPVNYYKQSYYFKSLQMKSLRLSPDIFRVLKFLTFNKVKVEEPITFAFEKLQVGDVIYKNVVCFFRRGFIKIICKDVKGDVFTYEWTGDLKNIPDNLDDVSIKKTKNEEWADWGTWDEEFKKIEQDTLEALPEGLQPKFLEKLSHVKSEKSSDKKMEQLQIKISEREEELRQQREQQRQKKLEDQRLQEQSIEREHEKRGHEVA